MKKLKFFFLILISLFVSALISNHLPQDYVNFIRVNEFFVYLGLFLSIIFVGILMLKLNTEAIRKHAQESENRAAEIRKNTNFLGNLGNELASAQKEKTELASKNEKLEEELQDLKEKQSIVFDQAKITGLEKAITAVSKSLEATTKELSQKTELLSHIESSSKVSLEQSESINLNMARLSNKLTQAANFVQDSPDAVKDVFKGVNNPSTLAKVYASVELMKQSSNSSYQRDAADALLLLQDNDKISNREFLIAAWVIGKTFSGSRVSKDMFNYVENVFPELIDKKEEE